MGSKMKKISIPVGMKDEWSQYKDVADAMLGVQVGMCDVSFRKGGSTVQLHGRGSKSSITDAPYFSVCFGLETRQLGKDKVTPGKIAGCPVLLCSWTPCSFLTLWTSHTSPTPHQSHSCNLVWAGHIPPLCFSDSLLLLAPFHDFFLDLDMMIFLWTLEFFPHPWILCFLPPGSVTFWPVMTFGITPQITVDRFLDLWMDFKKSTDHSTYWSTTPPFWQHYSSGFRHTVSKP